MPLHSAAAGAESCFCRPITVLWPERAVRQHFIGKNSRPDLARAENAATQCIQQASLGVVDDTGRQIVQRQAVRKGEQILAVTF